MRYVYHVAHICTYLIMIQEDQHHHVDNDEMGHAESLSLEVQSYINGCDRPLLMNGLV
jgi:hypothetical protein